MENNSKKITVYEFSDFELHLDREQLFRSNERIKLEPQQFMLLHLLISHPSQLVSRNLIEETLWAGRPVSDDAFRAAIKKLRDALGDDARSPRYIKTIPKQGLKWLAPAMTRGGKATVVGRGLSAQRYLKPASVFLVFLAAVWLVQLALTAPKPSNIVQKTEVIAANLTNLSGSEVFADYHEDHNKLVFLHRAERSSPQQLYIKLLDTGNVQRLSWDEANYSNSYWSNDGRRIAYNRLWKGKRSVHIASLNENNQLIDVKEIPHLLLQDKFVVGWTYDDAGLLLAEELTPDTQHGIHLLSLAGNALSPISFPNVAGRGDYTAAQSPDGSKLAILREVTGGQANLVITSMANGNLESSQTLPFMPTRLTWQNSDTVLMSSFFGDFARFLLGPNTLDTSITLPDNTLDVFASCGEQCAVLRQHNGDFLDIQEKPLTSFFSASDRDEPSLANGRLMKFPDAEGLPVYGPDSNDVYFVSVKGQYHYLNKLDANHTHSVLARFSRKQQLTALSLSPDGLILAGIVNRRLFVVSTDVDKGDAPDYLTTALEHVDNPTWARDSNTLYITHYSANQPGIISYNIRDEERSMLQVDMLAFQPIEKTGEAVGIDSQLMAWLLKKSGDKWERQRQLTTVQSANVHRWKWRGDTLFYTKAENTLSSLCAFTLVKDSAPRCASTGNNRFRLSFDVSPDRRRVLMVDSLGAQSNIIQLSW